MAKKPKVEMLKKNVQEKIDLELKSPKQLAKLDKEVAYEEDKQKAALKRSKDGKTKKKVKGAASKVVMSSSSEDEKEEEPEPEPQPAEDEVGITSLLLVIKNAAPVTPHEKKPHSRASFAMML